MESDRRDDAGSPRRVGRRVDVGDDRRPRERDRSELGRAGRFARSGNAAQPGVDQPVIPLAQPVLGEAEELAVLEVLRSGQLSLGPRVPAFEAAFAERVGSPYASAVSSGTSALHLGLRAVGVSDGDEVITSPFSFAASPNAGRFEGSRRVFVDFDRPTLTLAVEAAAAATSRRTSALLPVHIFGYPADLPALER